MQLLPGSPDDDALLPGQGWGEAALSQHPRQLARWPAALGVPGHQPPHSASTACSWAPQAPLFPEPAQVARRPHPQGRGAGSCHRGETPASPSAYPPFAFGRARCDHFRFCPGVTQTSDDGARKLPHCPRPAPTPPPPGAAPNHGVPPARPPQRRRGIRTRRPRAPARRVRTPRRFGPNRSKAGRRAGARWGGRGAPFLRGCSRRRDSMQQTGGPRGRGEGWELTAGTTSQRHQPAWVREYLPSCLDGTLPGRLLPTWRAPMWTPGPGQGLGTVKGPPRSRRNQRGLAQLPCI